MQTTHKVHDLTAYDMRDAYDLTQCCEEIKDGDILRAVDGWAVMVEAWPVIVGSYSESFHTPTPDFHEQTANKYRAQFDAITTNADQLAQLAQPLADTL